MGKVIRRARTRAGLTQNDLAQHLGITFQQVQKYETGNNRVHFTVLLDVSCMLGTTPEALLREYREVVGDESVVEDDAGRDDRDIVRLMGLAHQVDNNTRKAVIELLAARVRSEKAEDEKG
ncbi:helix-turn-helix domain-containing protein [Rhodovibrio sodomensis]|nr:helix-turn-helix transcriptional regulator [Rhodovibrio sodomensis]